MRRFLIVFSPAVLFFVLLWQPSSFSQEKEKLSGLLKGIVLDENGNPIQDANIIILETSTGTSSGKDGRYIIKNLKSGSYTVKASFIGFDSFVRQVSINSGQVTEVGFILKSSAFQIGGIEVVSERELIPTDPVTKTTISSGEIEHYQASSMYDVLDLVPGIEKSDNPGIGKTQQAAIRNGIQGNAYNELNSFGTLIIIDEVPISNNANMQFEKMTNSKTGISNLGGGIDIRTIPADNIESIEVITGLASVRYGDATDGVIKVTTKAGFQPNRLKIKNNPDTREANLGGGFKLGEKGLNYNINFARSERDLRKVGDEYSRLTMQSIFSGEYWGNTLALNNKLGGQIIFDEEEPKGDVLMTKNYNRGYSVNYSAWGKYFFEKNVSNLDFNLFVNFRKENSMRSRLILSDLRILPSGDTVSSYKGKIETRGVEWTTGGRIEWNNRFYTGTFFHHTSLGTDMQYNANTGEGLVFDTLFSYYGTASNKRPYRFDEIPGQLLANLYAEDNISGHLLCDFQLTLGLRYEMYRPFKFNLKGFWGDGSLIEARQGSYFNPRINLMLHLSNEDQLRFSAGKTSKSPAMSSIYSPSDGYKWRNPSQGSIISQRIDLSNPDLKGIQETQFEISYDRKFWNFVGISVNAFYKERRHETASEVIPIFAFDYFSPTHNIYYLDTYSRNQNTGRTISKGVELSLKTKKIKPINTYFEIAGSYQFSDFTRGGLEFDSAPDPAKGQYPNYKVPNIPVDTLIGFMYPRGNKLQDKIQINYYLHYTVSSLGLWITLRAEEILQERFKDLVHEPADISKLTASALETYNFIRSLKTHGNKWLLNLNVTKSLSKGAEISFYVNNFLDDPAVEEYSYSTTLLKQNYRNPPLFYGIEFSCIIDELFK